MELAPLGIPAGVVDNEDEIVSGKRGMRNWFRKGDRQAGGKVNDSGSAGPRPQPNGSSEPAFR